MKSSDSFSSSYIDDVRTEIKPKRKVIKRVPPKEQKQSNYNQNIHEVNSTRKPKFKHSDKYRKVIMSVISKVECAYGIDFDEVAGNIDRTSNMPILRYNDIIKSRINRMTSIQKRERNKKVSGYICSLLYINYSMEYNNVARIDFSNIKKHVDISKTVKNFLVNSKNKENLKLDLNYVVHALKCFENDRAIGVFEEPSYRLLRLFYTCVMHDNLIDASIIARLILHQAR